MPSAVARAGVPRRAENIHARVPGAFARKRIGTPSEAAHEHTVHGPDAGPCVEMPAARKLKAREIGSAEVIIFGDGLRKGRYELAFGGDVDWPLQLLLNSVSNGNFVGQQLERGKLLVGLVYHSLQVLISDAQFFRLPAQGIVV